MQPNAIAKANGVHKLTCRRKEFSIAYIVERHIGVFLGAQAKSLKKIDRSFFRHHATKGKKPLCRLRSSHWRSFRNIDPTRIHADLIGWQPEVNEPLPVKLASRENKPGGPVAGVTLGHARSMQRRTEIDAMTLDDVWYLQKIERWHEIDEVI
jgi:hypothetical protein